MSLRLLFSFYAPRFNWHIIPIATSRKTVFKQEPVTETWETAPSTCHGVKAKAYPNSSMPHNAYPKMQKKIFISIFFFLNLGTATGCISLNEYAVKYRVSPSFQEETGPGQQSNNDDHLDKDAPQEQTTRAALHHMKLPIPTHHCHYFRNQLFVASEAAQEHIWWVWAFPGYWPLHILTLYILPVDETRTAYKVIDAAQKMEMAYQAGDNEFLSTCSKIMNEAELGAAFAQENPLLEP